MKELTIEEKAKRYDEAIERARIYSTTTNSVADAELIELIFPELAESEDERIRRVIRGWIYTRPASFFDNGISKEEILVWLEKQGEQKKSYDTCDSSMMDNKKSPCSEKRDFGYFEEKFDNQNCIKSYAQEHIGDKVEPKFKVGDILVSDEEDRRHIYKVDAITNYDTYLLLDLEDGYTRNEPTYTSDLAMYLWTIQDAKDGDVLVYKDEISIYKNDIKNCTKEDANFGGFVYHCCYDGKRFIIDSLYSLTEKDKKDIYPATKEQHNLFFQKMREAGYEWNAEKKELKKIENEIEIPFGAKDSELQEATYYIPKGFHAEIEGNNVIIKKGKQKSAWSEDDEEQACGILKLLEESKKNYIYVGGIENNIKWFKEILKSLRPQSQWKPSDEQMGVIEAVINNRSFQRRHLNSLYEQLKKLKG